MNDYDRKKLWAQRNIDKVRESRAKYQAVNKQKVLASKRRYREKNRTSLAESCRAYRLANPERTRSATARWRSNNVEKAKYLVADWMKRNRDRMRAIREDYNRRFPERLSEMSARKRAVTLQRIPLWANFELIRAFYAERDRITAQTGIPHQVDHIIPLQGKFVSGLHVHTNLRVITRLENRRKSNNFNGEETC